MMFDLTQGDEWEPSRTQVTRRDPIETATIKPMMGWRPVDYAAAADTSLASSLRDSASSLNASQASTVKGAGDGGSGGWGWWYDLTLEDERGPTFERRSQGKAQRSLKVRAPSDRPNVVLEQFLAWPMTH